MDLLQSVPKEKNFGSVRKESHYATPNGESTCNGEPLVLQGMNSGLEQQKKRIITRHQTKNPPSIPHTTIRMILGEFNQWNQQHVSGVPLGLSRNFIIFIQTRAL